MFWDDSQKFALLEELTAGQEYWHVTGRESFEEIVKEGEIRAMPKAESCYSGLDTVARYLNGVSLSDFNSPELASAEERGGHHWNFFNRPPCAMAIGIDPKQRVCIVMRFRCKHWANADFAGL